MLYIKYSVCAPHDFHLQLVRVVFEEMEKPKSSKFKPFFLFWYQNPVTEKACLKMIIRHV